MRNRVLQAFAKRGIRPGVVLDVGANIGQSYQEFRAALPDAVIHSFEPIRVSYDALAAAIGDDPRGRAHHLALSRAAGTLTMSSKGQSTGNRVVAHPRGGTEIESVRAETGDAFCAREGISQVDFLKVDAEGHDLDVVVGFHNMLIGGAVRFVQVECGLSPANTIHVAFGTIANLLHSFGFGLYGLFGLTPLRGSANLAAHYGDAVFVRDA